MDRYARHLTWSASGRELPTALGGKRRAEDGGRENRGKDRNVT